MKKSWILLVLLFVVNLPVVAGEKSSMMIEEVWARENPPMVTTGAAYMTLINRGDEADRLLEISGDVADRIELHTHSMEEGVMKMRRIEVIEVGPEEPTVLEPGSLHVMLIGLKEPLVAGRTFPLALNFERAGQVLITVVVRGMGESQEANP